MLKILPILIISSTIPISEQKIIYLDNDYSEEVAMCDRENKVNDSQDTSEILYNLILEDLIRNYY
jgi:hypothetical protein